VKDAIGWASSFILVCTISKQVYDQWRTGRSEGVSTWLFIGEMASATGFAAYSWMLHNVVYVVANGFTLLSSVIGFVVLLRNRRRAARERA
jgi:uncharacterized protein with PQ loop repeat